MPTPHNPYELEARWSSFRKEHPGARIRDAADALGVSEAELLATGCGESVTRLEGPWETLLAEFKSLGPLLALTRNDAAVHEKTGHYRNVSFDERHQMGMVLSEAIDLRLFMQRWKLGFAVTKTSKAGRGLRGFQFFDGHGTAIHKTWLRDESDEDRYETLIDQYRSVNQDRSQPVKPRPIPPSERPDDAIDREALLADWKALQDTHDFVFLLRKHGVSRMQALRLAEGPFTRQVAAGSIRTLLQHASSTETPVMIFVRNRGCIQIHAGPIHRLKATGEWFNVLDPDFNLHLREPLIDTAWVVQKPTKDGTVTSLELYDEDHAPIVRIFGRRPREETEPDSWREIVTSLK